MSDQSSRESGEQVFSTLASELGSSVHVELRCVQCDQKLEVTRYHWTCPSHGVVREAIASSGVRVRQSIASAHYAASLEPVTVRCKGKGCGKEFKAKSRKHRFCPDCLQHYVLRGMTTDDRGEHRW